MFGSAEAILVKSLNPAPANSKGFSLPECPTIEYKFRLDLKPAQREMCKIFAGHNRFVWNKFLKINKMRLANNTFVMNYYEMSKWLTILKQQENLSFFKEAQSQTLQQTLKDLERAFKDCFDKNQPMKWFPQFKKKGKCNDSFRFPTGSSIKEKKQHDKTS